LQDRLDVGAAGSGPLVAPQPAPAGLWVSCLTRPLERPTTKTSAVGCGSGVVRRKARCVPSWDQAGRLSRTPGVEGVRPCWWVPSRCAVTICDVVRLVSVYRRKAISPAGVADAGIGGIETCDVATLLGDAPDDVKEQAWTETTRRATTAPAPMVAIRFLPEKLSAGCYSPFGERDTNNPSRVVTVARAW